MAIRRTVYFRSRSGGARHKVQINTAHTGVRYVMCSCPGGRFAFSQGRGGVGCHAMVRTRQRLGIPEPTPVDPQRFNRVAAKMRAEVFAS